MALLAVVGALLVFVAIGIREYQLGRERAALGAAIDLLRSSLDSTRAQLKRTAEDLFVLQSVLAERNVLDEDELLRGRARLVDAPRRQAEERAAMARHLKVSPTQLVVDDTEPKLH